LGEFFRKNGIVDEVVEIDKRSSEGRNRALSRLASEEWDVIFVPHESPRTALWMRRLRARRGKIGFHKWWNFAFFTRRVVKPMHLPDALRQMSLLAALDGRTAERFATGEVTPLQNPDAQTSQTDFRQTPIPDWASMQVLAPQSAARRIFMAPGSVWNTKRWTARGYKDLARLLLERGDTVELVGSGAEKALCEEIAQAVPGVINRAGTTSMAGLGDLLREGTALVCNDSGAMHVAAAVGLPTVAVFGPTVLAQGFRPWQTQAIVVQRTLSCRPCGKHGSQTCPIGTHACMEEINATEVLSALENLLGPKVRPS
jgi:heptosyltransferase-2